MREGLTEKGGRIAGAAASVALAAVMFGCGGARGTSGRCLYGVSRGHNDNRIHCKSRPKPSRAVAAQAASAVPMTRALERFARARPRASVNAVGINWWGETTFTIDTGGSGKGRYQLVTYGPDGRRTSGRTGYVYDHFSQPFPVSDVHPRVLARLVAAVRVREPDNRFVRAIISVDGVTDELIWRFEMTGPHIEGATDYAAFPNGAGFCHDKSDSGSAPGVPACGVNLGLIDFTA